MEKKKEPSVQEHGLGHDDLGPETGPRLAKAREGGRGLSVRRPV